MILSSSDYQDHQQRLLQLSKTVYEYLLIISPDQVISAGLAGIKNVFKTNYGCEYSANLHPHITLINFVQFEVNEKYFIHYFERFSKSISPFDIQLNGFGGFPPSTIYVNVLTKAPIINIVKGMKTKFSGFLQPTKHQKPSFILNPHLTIARQMQASQYNTAWAEWKDKEYISTFRANEMRLLKRKITGSRCETITIFPFGGNGMSDVQLMLPL